MNEAAFWFTLPFAIGFYYYIVRKERIRKEQIDRENLEQENSGDAPALKGGDN